MDSLTIHALTEMNSSFYQAVGDSFSATRKFGWPGWSRVLDLFDAQDGEQVNLLDVACGNWRFERFLWNEQPQVDWNVTGVDVCDELSRISDAQEIEHLPVEPTFISCDVVSELASGRGLHFGSAPFDFIVSFGFMHHVPSHQLRLQLIEQLLSHLEPDGLLALSFWRFADIPEMKLKAEKTTEMGVKAHSLLLENNDYLLGWDGKADHLRYCHSFDDAEISDLVSAVDSFATCVERFESDGRNKQLNTYVVLKRM